MRSLPPAIVAAALALVLASHLHAQQRVVAFEGVSVVPMDRERVLTNQTVIVTGDRITTIGDGQVQIPAGAARIDGRGKFLMPALAEMHAHVPAGAAAERVLFLYVANGIGTIRSMLGSAEHFRLRERAQRGEIVAPAMILAGPSFNGQTASTPQAASSRVTDQKRAGYDLLKIHPGIPRDAFDALAATAAQQGIRFAGHVPAAVGLGRALDTKFWTIDHLDGYMEALAGAGAPAADLFGVNLVERIDESRMAALVKQTVAAGTWNVPTQVLLESWFGTTDAETMRRWPEMQYASPGEVNSWVNTKREMDAMYPRAQRERFIAVRRRMIKALHDGGAGLLLGSDAPQVWNVPGFSMHRELQTYVASGLTPYQALATGTRNVAAHLGTMDRTGTVETGKRADLLLLDANPLQDVANASRIAGVMVGGTWLSKADIDRRLATNR